MSLRSFVVLFFRRLYELGAEKGWLGARGGAARRREDHLHHAFSETRGAEVAKRPRALRPRWASLEVAGDDYARYWGAVLAGSEGGHSRHLSDAEDTWRRRDGDGHMCGCKGAVVKKYSGASQERRRRAKVFKTT